jgi:hypothetical protein
MSDYLLKTIFAVALLAVGLYSFLTMMARFGRPGDEVRSEKLRKRHKVSGYLFIALLAPLAVLGVDFLAEMGDGLSARGALHFLLADLLLAILLLKFLIVKSYRQLMRFANGLGMALFAVTLVIFLITAVFFAVQKLLAG